MRRVAAIISRVGVWEIKLTCHNDDGDYEDDDADGGEEWMRCIYLPVVQQQG